MPNEDEPGPEDGTSYPEQKPRATDERSVRDASDFPATGELAAADDQVRFLGNIERILTEGSFVATYKYALLLALVDLSIEKGDDSGRELTLDITEVADRFAELYWRQAAPYSSSPIEDAGFVLHQNCGKQASAIRMVADLRRSMPNLSVARRTRDWQRLVQRMSRLLKSMPLWRLQLLRSERLEFLYRPGPGRDQITLLPWVARHLRQRALLIRRLAQTE